MADRLEFEIDVELETGLITGHAGGAGLIEGFRQTGTGAVIDREIKLKSRKRGLSASEMVESLLAMWAAGGERAEDLDQFRQDKALALLLGHELPAAQTARDFLAQFHADDLPLLQEGKSSVPTESVPLLGLKEGRILFSHSLQKQTSIKKKVPDLATRFSDEQTAMAGSAMGRSIPAPVIRFVIGADWVIRANPQALQGIPKDIGKSGSGGDQTTQRSRGACARAVDQHAAAVE